MVYSDLRSYTFLFLLFLVVHVVLPRGSNGVEVRFDQNYKVLWGGNHVVPLNQGNEIELILDKSSGGGFGSKMIYGSGFFHMRIKIPAIESQGVITTVYLTSDWNNHSGRIFNHDEIDFEFYGSNIGSYALQTNIFADDSGNREQKVHLWFDPTANFHDYSILWNQYQIVFFVDNIPIRVFKNKRNIGVKYPSKPMQVRASLWQADWAGKTDWRYAPFRANFQEFDITGCPVQTINDCGSNKYYWNGLGFRQLDPIKERQYQMIKQKYLIYDYCNDRRRFPKPPKECLV